MENMDKKIQLAVDFSKAPKEIQDAATAIATQVKAIKKAEKKFFDAKEDLRVQGDTLQIMYKEYTEKVSAFNSLLDKWEPEASAQATVK